MNFSLDTLRNASFALACSFVWGTALASPTSEPMVASESAIVMDALTGKVLYQKDPHAKRHPASTTKIMTAMVVLDRCRLDEVVTAPMDVETVGQSSMHLKPGEKITIRDLLSAIMLRSANDASYAAAIHVAGSVAGFADLMNQKAAQIGCKNTNFKNPSGLTEQGHLTTAYDLARMTQAAMRDPEFRSIVRMPKALVERSINQDDRWMINRNKLLRRDETIDGVKTGWTVPAGHCFVGSSTRNGFRVITVVLDSSNWQEDTQTLVSYAFENFHHAETLKPGTEVITVPVEGGTQDRVIAGVAKVTSMITRKGDVRPANRDLVSEEPLQAPIQKGAKVGDLRWTDPDGHVQVVPLVALESVEAEPLVVAALAGAHWSFWVTAGALGIAGWCMRRKSRQKIRTYAGT